MNLTQTDLPGTKAKRRNRSLLPAFALIAVTALLYGSHLADGLLSDDFLYASWASESFGSLLRHLTIDSYPKVLRPVPALFWLATRAESGHFLLHLLSILVHGANAVFIFRILRERAAERTLAFLLALAFCAFPLFAESVVWLSGSFDLWATLFALLALTVLGGGAEKWRPVAAAGLFLLALLCKESVFMLPVLLLLVLPRRSALVSCAATAGAAAAYLLVRFAIFGGLGGYVTSQGQTTVESFAPSQFLRALVLQLPARLLVPLEVSSSFVPALALFSGVLLAALALLGRRRWSVWAPLLAALGFVVALLPAAGVFRVEWDLEGSRLLYFPMAVALVILGLKLRGAPRPASGVMGILVVWWGVCAVLNARSWHQAHLTVERTLSAMQAAERRFPAGATVLVDTRDSEEGAYVFRNGLPEAARLRGLRGDLEWKRGTAALFGPSEATSRLGVALFEIGATHTGGTIDWTECERSLFLARADSLPARALAHLPLSPVGGKASALRWVSPAVAPTGAPGGIAAWLLARPCGRQSILTGTLFWRTDPGRPFTTTQERRFSLPPGPSAVPVRLPHSVGQASRLELRVDVEGAALPTACWNPVLLSPLPVTCPAAE
jgi:hypothetical protein